MNANISENPTVPRAFCVVLRILIRCLTRNQIPGEKQDQRGVYNPTVVHTVTHLGVTTWFAKSRIREVRGRGFGPLGSHP